MTNNEKFNKALKESGLSMYELARYAGVPYTTINELHLGKNDINKCAAGTVKRIAAVLDVPIDSILNDMYYLDGVKGRYKGIDYIWSTGEVTQLTFNYEGEEVTMDDGVIYNVPRWLRYYHVAAEMMIRDYIEKQQWKKEALAEIERMKTDG